MKNIVTEMLCLEVSGRLTSGPDGVQKLKSHQFYTKLDWKKLEQRKMKPPFKPDLNQAGWNKNNFDSNIRFPQEVSYEPDGSGWDENFATWVEEEVQIAPIVQVQH